MKRLLVTASLAALLCVSGASAQDHGQDHALVLQGGTLIDGTGQAPITDSVIVVKYGRILAVGKRGDIAIPAGAEIIDTTGRTILPGLIDMHLHLRGWRIPLYLHYGITTTADIHNDTTWILAERALLKSGFMQGPRMFVTGARVDGPNGDRLVDSTGKVVEDPSYVKTPEEARAYVRYLAAQGVDFIKVDFSLTDEQLAAVYDEAAKYHLRVIGHINNIDTAMSYGATEIEHLIGVFRAELIREGKPVPTDFGALNSGVGVDMSKIGPLINKMVDHKVALDIALYDWVKPTVWGTEKAEVEALANDPNTAFIPQDAKNQWLAEPRTGQEAGYKQTVAFLKQFAAAGGHFTIDSDGNGKTDIVPGLATHFIMEGVAKMGISPMQIIQSATLWEAEVIGVDKDYGSVEVGKAADIDVIDGNPLVDMKTTRNIKMVIMDGKVVDTKLDPKFVNPLPRGDSLMNP